MITDDVLLTLALKSNARFDAARIKFDPRCSINENIDAIEKAGQEIGYLRALEDIKEYM